MMAGDTVRERFRALIRALFADNTEEEALALWRYDVENRPQQARETLAVLDAILADPPPDLVELMENDGWIHLVHRPDEWTATPYSHDEYVAWLRDITARMRAV